MPAAHDRIVSAWRDTANRSSSRSRDARSPFRTRTRCCSRKPATPSSIWRAITSPCRKARCAAPADGRTSSCAIRTASTASSSSRSARPNRGRPGSRSCRCSFPSGRSAEEVVPRDAAALVWMANLACLELHPHPVRADDLDHPDELRVDLDPVPGVEWSQIRKVAGVVRATLDDFGLVGWPKTSGSRGMHIYVRIERRWTFDEVRRAALALAREVERRAPALATSKWWKEERHGVFLDYNQNAKDRTIASAYSVRPTADARVSAPLAWDEIDACEPGDFTLRTMPARFAQIGDRHAAIDQHAGSLDAAARAVGSAEGRRAGRRPVAASLPQAAGRSSARHAVPAPDARQPFSGRRRGAEGADIQAPADRNRPRAQESRRARRARALEGASPGCERASRTRRRARGRDARPFSNVDAHSRQPAARPRDAQARTGAARSRRRSQRLARRAGSAISEGGRTHRRPSRARKES